MFKPEEAQGSSILMRNTACCLQVTAAHIPNGLKKLGDQKSI